MSTPFLGELRIFSFGFAPKGWAMCNGQTLPINQNPALFSLLGTTYGGNGVQNFELPNLAGRVPVHFGSGFTQGQVAGEEAHTLLVNEMPLHNHVAEATSNPGDSQSPGGNFWATEPFGATFLYAPGSGTVAMAPQAIGQAGGSQPHTNMQPYLVLNFCIALTGIFPSRN